MARPAGVAKATKDNSRKLHANREQWMAGKKLGRSKQQWIWDIEPTLVEGVLVDNGIGHWEKL
jgi:hypothetical protein